MQSSSRYQPPRSGGEKAPGRTLIQDQVRHEARCERASDTLHLGDSACDAHTPRHLAEHGEVRAARTLVQRDSVMATVFAEEHGGDVAHHAVPPEGLVVGLLEVAAHVDMARHLGEGRTDTEERDIHRTLDLQHAQGRTLTPEGLLGLRGVEEGRNRELLDRRPEGVTEAAAKLQKAGLISYTRGRIEVLDRVGLEKRSCECYAVVKAEYDRLLPMQIAT